MCGIVVGLAAAAFFFSPIVLTSFRFVSLRFKKYTHMWRIIQPTKISKHFPASSLIINNLRTYVLPTDSLYFLQPFIVSIRFDFAFLTYNSFAFLFLIIVSISLTTITQSTAAFDNPAVHRTGWAASRTRASFATCTEWCTPAHAVWPHASISPEALSAFYFTTARPRAHLPSKLPAVFHEPFGLWGLLVCSQFHVSWPCMLHNLWWACSTAASVVPSHICISSAHYSHV